jgi:hypothetical protein
MQNAHVEVGVRILKPIYQDISIWHGSNLWLVEHRKVGYYITWLLGQAREKTNGLCLGCKFVYIDWSIHSNVSSAYFGLGRLEREEGDLDSAIKQYRLAAETLKPHGALHDFVAACYYHLGSIALDKGDVATSMWVPWSNKIPSS